MLKKKVIIAIAVIVLAILAFLTWYKFQYSMCVAMSFEINTPESKHRVLIATQGSKFKDAIVSGVVDHLKQSLGAPETIIKVIIMGGRSLVSTK
jgi:hypothetical protein